MLSTLSSISHLQGKSLLRNLLQNMAASEEPNPGAQALRVFPGYFRFVSHFRFRFLFAFLFLFAFSFFCLRFNFFISVSFFLFAFSFLLVFELSGPPYYGFFVRNLLK